MVPTSALNHPYSLDASWSEGRVQLLAVPLSIGSPQLEAHLGPRLGIGLGSVKVGGLQLPMPGPGQGPPKLQCDTPVFIGSADLLI